MDKIPDKIRITIAMFINDLIEEIPVEKVILFGSYAKNTYHKDSDIDLAIFSSKFEGMSGVNAMRYLLRKAFKYAEVDMQPVGYSYNEYLSKDNPFIQEILDTGIEINIEELEKVKSA